MNSALSVAEASRPLKPEINWNLHMNHTPVIPAPIQSPYLNRAEAAAYVRTTDQGIYSLVKRGRLRPMPGSRRLLFTHQELDRYLATRYR
jgi:excisionase family DNA binding protein